MPKSQNLGEVPMPKSQNFGLTPARRPVQKCLDQACATLSSAFGEKDALRPAPNTS
jgi:hypothetical protein